MRRRAVKNPSVPPGVQDDWRESETVTFTDVLPYVIMPKAQIQIIMPKAQIQIQISFSPAPQKISPSRIHRRPAQSISAYDQHIHIC
jgi:hypothetical protein